MRRLLIAFVAAAFAAVSLGGAALAKADPTYELTVVPDEPKAGDTVTLQAYVHFGTKPYQGANVEFKISGPGLAQPMILHGKPGEPGYYRQQFVAKQSGNFEIVTLIDGRQLVSKPYPLLVSQGPATSTDWAPFAAGAGALALAAIAGIAFMRRSRVARVATITS